MKKIMKHYKTCLKNAIKMPPMPEELVEWDKVKPFGKEFGSNMERERSLQLSQQDAMTLTNALDQPAKLNNKLQQAASHYIDKNQ